MKSLQYCLLAFAIIAISPSLKAQTAEEIIAKYIDAIGGKDKINAINSVRMGTTISANGTDASGSIVVVNGKGYRNESDWGGQKVIQVFTDKSGWTQNPFVGVNDPQALPDDAYKMGQYQIYLVPLLDYASHGDKAELLGQERIGGGGGPNTYKIRVTNPNGMASTYYLDVASNLPIQSITTSDFAGQKTEVTTTYSDYVKSDAGWLYPQTVGIDFGGNFSMTSKVSKIEINPAIDSGIFEMKK
jgi:hypothetical protein